MTSSVVLPWSHILYGSLVGPSLGVILLLLLGERSGRTLGVAAVAASAGTWLWNSMLNLRHAHVIDGDVPFRPFPISWQDTGTAIFAFAVITAALLATVHKNQPGSRTLKIAGVITSAVLIVDIYTW